MGIRARVEMPPPTSNQRQNCASDSAPRTEPSNRTLDLWRHRLSAISRLRRVALRAPLKTNEQHLRERLQIHRQIQRKMVSRLEKCIFDAFPRVVGWFLNLFYTFWDFLDIEKIFEKNQKFSKNFLS